MNVLGFAIQFRADLVFLLTASVIVILVLAVIRKREK